jgi:glycosyltransferase involved in cell wall biosynthesis
MSVSAIIPTYNEEDLMKTVLKSIDWCDEIILVDSNSTDRTREIAREHGAKIVNAPRPDPAEPFDHYRNLGIEAASNDLVLFLDADECIPDGLRDRLQEIAKQHINEVGVVRAPTMNYLGDKPLSGGFYWPGYRPLLANKNKIEIKRRIHNFYAYDEDEVYDLPAEPELAIQHDFADSIHEQWKAQRGYAKRAGGNRKFNPIKIFIAPPWGFYHQVIENDGWRDGIAGVALGLFYSWFLFETHVRTTVQSIIRS